MSAYIGKGKIKLADFSSGASFGLRNFRDIANTSVFRFSFTEQEVTLEDFRDASGGTDASYKRIDAVSGQIDPRHYTAENLAMVLWGATSAVAATPITNEAHIIKEGGFIATDRIIDTTVAPVVKKGATVIDTDDYIVSTGGITIAATITTATVVDGDAITIDYTPKAGADIQGIINSAPTMSLLFEGVNANTGNPLIVRAHKVKLGVAQNVDMIGSDFGTLTVSLSFEKDDTITTPGLSKYLSIQTTD